MKYDWHAPRDSLPKPVRAPWRIIFQKFRAPWAMLRGGRIPIAAGALTGGILRNGYRR